MSVNYKNISENTVSLIMILLLVLFSLAGSQARPQDVEIVTLQDETITENPIVDMELGDTEGITKIQIIFFSS